MVSHLFFSYAFTVWAFGHCIEGPAGHNHYQFSVRFFGRMSASKGFFILWKANGNTNAHFSFEFSAFIHL